MVTLGFLKENKSAVVALLMEQGLTAEAADEKYALFFAAVGHLSASGHADDVKCHCYWVPGRIEVVGKHTDYAGGRSLLCAISRGFACVSVDNDDGIVNVLSEFNGEQHKASLKVGSQLRRLAASRCGGRGLRVFSSRRQQPGWPFHCLSFPTLTHEANQLDSRAGGSPRRSDSLCIDR